MVPSNNNRNNWPPQYSPLWLGLLIDYVNCHWLLTQRQYHPMPKIIKTIAMRRRRRLAPWIGRRHNWWWLTIIQYPTNNIRSVPYRIRPVIASCCWRNRWYRNYYQHQQPPVRGIAKRKSRVVSYCCKTTSVSFIVGSSTGKRSFRVTWRHDNDALRNRAL